MADEMKRTTVNGRPAVVAYLNADFEPVEPAQATLIKVIYTDEQGGHLFLRPKAKREAANEPKPDPALELAGSRRRLRQ